MSKYTGDNGTIKVTGGLTPLAELVSFNIDETVETISTNTMDGTCSADVEPGVKSWSGSIETFYDPSDAGYLGLVLGAAVLITFYPFGELSGDMSITGTALITGISKSVAADSMITASITLSGKGDLVEALIP